MNKVCFFMLLFVFAWNRLFAQQPDLGTDAQREAGKKLYDQKCSQCHGENGDGNGVAAPFYKPAPRDFTGGQFKIRITENGELPTDNDMKQIIKKGMPYTGMPPWPDLSNNQLSNLAYYMKTFCEDFADPDYLPQALEMPKAPQYSEESVQKGRAVFEANECIACHGNLGRGDGESAPELVDEWGKHIRSADMTKRWTFRGGGTREDIYRTFTTGMNGTPMPSYSGLIEPDDQWHLVDYVYSLSKDEPDYATIIIAKGIEGEVDIREGTSLFQDAPGALLPVVGQIIEPGREFFPSALDVDVKVVYNQDEIAIMLTWNDMSAEKTGKNSPAIAVPVWGTEEKVTGVFSDNEEESAESAYSDAVAVQLPSKMPEGIAKPFFIFGDRRNSVDIWFADLAKSEPSFFIGKGSQNITSGDSTGLSVSSKYEDGQWIVMFKKKRSDANGLTFAEGNFVPIAFSIWDGFNKERGSKRGITSWYNLYIEPMQTASVAWPMVKWGMLTFILQVGLIFLVRRKYKNQIKREIQV